MGVKLYYVDSKYLRYLNKIDHRIPVKYNNRPVVVLTVKINNYIYAVPLTSQTTKERKAAGKKKIKNSITTFIRDSKGVEIANLLHNDMFPVLAACLIEMKLDPKINSYEIMEQRYLRRNMESINRKSLNVYHKKYDHSHPEHNFIDRISCDFKALEKACDAWEKKVK